MVGTPLPEPRKLPIAGRLATSTALLISVSLFFAVSCGGKSRLVTPASEDPSDDDGEGTRGGQRLRAVFLESADGVGVFLHFRDTELDLACIFEPIDSDTWRCLPGEGVVRGVEVVYTDAECTDPQAGLYPTVHGLDGCTPPRYVVTGGSCGTEPRVFELGPSSSADTRYRLRDGACSLSNDPLDDSRVFHTVTPIPLERFALARLRAGDETEGVVPRELRSDDGTRIVVGFRDAQEGFDCRLVGPEEDIRCAPADAGLIGLWFGDAGCTEPAAVPAVCHDQPEELSFAQELGGGTSFFRVGARLPAAYTGRAGNCAPTEDVAAFEIGSEVPFTRFVAGQRTVIAGSELEATVDTVGTAALPPRALQSTMHGGYDCHVAHGTDGELRCLPRPSGTLEPWFADAECTQPVQRFQDHLVEELPGFCPPRYRVYALGERHSAPVYAGVTDGACAPAYDRPPNDSARTPYHVFPNEIVAAELPALFEVER